MLSRHQREIRRLLVFGVVGSANTAVCYAVFAALVHLLEWDYNLALVADYAFGALLGFTLHSTATFGDRKHARMAFGKYAVTLVLAFLLNIALLNVTVKKLGVDPLPGQALSIMFVTLLSYSMQRFWVFRSHHQPEPTLDPDLEPCEETPVEV